MTHIGQKRRKRAGIRRCAKTDHVFCAEEDIPDYRAKNKDELT